MGAEGLVMMQESWRPHGEHEALDGGENKAMTQARG
jgi:hypothetical protein